jgi:membrane-associated protein
MNNTLPYLLTLLQEYGYIVLWIVIFISAAGFPLPVSLLLLAAGAFAALGDFNIVILAAVAISAFVAGDNFGYLLGRRWGSRVLIWLETSGKIRIIKPKTLIRSRAYFHRLGGLAIFFSRFLVPALGGVINLLAGAELYPYRRFLVYDVSGETIAALLSLVLGYIFGASWDAVGDILGSFSFFILAFLIVLFLGYQTFRLLHSIRGSEKAKQRSVPEKPVELPIILPGAAGSDPKQSS